jgi:GDPmannose 4,6-dehydratase
MSRRALITGITGQDGSYLAEFLLAKDYEVHGMVRRASSENFERIEHLRSRIVLHQGDLLDPLSLIRLVETVQPRELYNLAAMTFVPASFTTPLLTAEFTGLGVTRVLEAVRLVNPEIRFYQASSSEMFGNVPHEPQNEDTPFRPRSPYGVAKAYGHLITVNYRESYGLFACGGIMFNHESPRRGKEFVTRKITDGVARIKHGLSGTLELGNLDAHRDWGFAGDYVRAMWLMLQRERPDDYVIATGVKHSVRQFAELAFARAGLNWQDHVTVDPSLLRPADVNALRGDASKARRDLGWEPEVSFEQLVAMMVDADVARVAAEVARG